MTGSRGSKSAPRDAEAERVIADGLRRAPNAIYPLVQTVLVQDEALKRADARIRELTGEDAEPTTGGGFLDSMRQALTGRSTSVPSVRPGAPDPRWNSGGAFPNANAAPAQGGGYGGGSFLGTAAASAAGVIGGALLLNSISSMFGIMAEAHSRPCRSKAARHGTTGTAMPPAATSRAMPGSTISAATDAAARSLPRFSAMTMMPRS